MIRPLPPASISRSTMACDESRHATRLDLGAPLHGKDEPIAWETTCARPAPVGIPLPESLHATAELGKALEGSQLVVLAVPSAGSG